MENSDSDSKDLILNNIIEGSEKMIDKSLDVTMGTIATVAKVTETGVSVIGDVAKNTLTAVSSVVPSLAESSEKMVGTVGNFAGKTVEVLLGGGYQTIETILTENTKAYSATLNTVKEMNVTNKDHKLKILETKNELKKVQAQFDFTIEMEKLKLEGIKIDGKKEIYIKELELLERQHFERERVFKAERKKLEEEITDLENSLERANGTDYFDIKNKVKKNKKSCSQLVSDFDIAIADFKREKDNLKYKLENT